MKKNLGTIMAEHKYVKAAFENERMYSASAVTRIADSYADQFKPKWIGIERADVLNSAPSERIVLLFENGAIRRWDEEYPFELIVGFFVLPEYQ